MTERKESARDISVTASTIDDPITVESLTLDESYNVETVTGSGFSYPSGYSINDAELSGSFTVKGHPHEYRDKFFDDENMPKVLSALTVTHYGDETTEYQDIVLTSRGYQMNSGEMVETAYEFIAMGRN